MALPLGDVSSVMQLMGLDAVSLIRVVVAAASTARAHKKICRQFAQQLTLIGNLLEQLRVSELKQHRCTREPLELLEDALRKSYILINNFHDCNYLYLLVMGWNIVRQLRNAQIEIAQYLDLIPLIMLVDIQRVRGKIENIKGEKHEYAVDEAGKKLKDALSNSGWLTTRKGLLGNHDSFLRIFKFKELRSATMDFSNQNYLGNGGYGEVFKGWIDNSSSKTGNSGFSLPKKGMNNGPKTAVAIKRMIYLSKEEIQPFLAQMNLLGSLLHPNVIRFLGYCREREILFVFQFSHRGILRHRLFPSVGYHPLSWDLRMKIAVGIARGVAFLQTAHVVRQIINMDAILLDWDFNPRLANFRLRTIGENTMEYQAPEYADNGHVNEKTDVYGFGVVLLEILCGKQATEIRSIGKISETTSQQNSIDICRTNQKSDALLCMALPYESVISSCISDYRRFTSLMDPALGGRYPMRGACLAAQLARSCVAADPASRPSMQEVVESIEYIQTIGTPPMEEASDTFPFLHDIDSSVSRTTAHESAAAFDADAELSFFN